MANYKKGLGLPTSEQRRANGFLGYANSFALLTYEQCLAIWKKGGKKCSIDHLITKEGMHSLAMGNTVVHGNYNGTGIVTAVRAPTSNSQNNGRSSVEFHDKQVGIKDVHITSLSCNGQRCQFVKEYGRTRIHWPKKEEDAIAQGYNWGKCTRCDMMGSCNHPDDNKKRHRHNFDGGQYA